MFQTSFLDKEFIAKLTAKMLIEVEAVRFSSNEPFKFTSGWASPVYIDCRKLISYPRVRHTLMDFAASVITRNIGFENIDAYEKALLDYATENLRKIDNIKIYGDVDEKISVISFNVADHHPSDIGSILDQFGIAVRTGQHCTQPIMDHFNIPGTVRASFAFYNTKSEIDLFIDAVKKAAKMLG